MEKLSIKMKHAVLFAAMGSLALFAQGCKDDTLGDIGDGNDGNGIAAGTHYLAFNIVSDAGSSTRSWPTDPQESTDFDAGSDQEQAITSVEGSNVVLLFTEDSTFHSMVNLNADKAGISSTNDRYETEGLEKTIGTFTANIKIAEGAELPKMLLVVLNGNPQRLSQLEIELKTGSLHLYDDAEKRELNPAAYTLAYLTRRLSDEAIGGSNSSIVLFSPNESDDEYCTMTNAVYVGPGDTKGDATTAGPTGTIYNFTEIKDNNICSTEDEAAKNPLTVHVERLAVKVELKLGNGTTEIDTTVLGVNDRGGFKFPVLIKPAGDNKVGQVVDGKDTTVNWAFSMLGWSTNAVARRMYLFKNLDDSRADISGGKEASSHYSAGEITTPFFNGWNDAKHARCYWAVDGHYADVNVYPLQYRVAKDNASAETAAKNSYKELAKEDGANMPLYYYSFQQLRMISMGLIPNADPKNLTQDNYEDFLQPGTLRKNAKYRYCGENVLGQNLISDPGRIWRGAATHVIIFGQLLLGNEIETYTSAVQGQQFTQESLKEASDKLYAAGSYWSRAGYMQYAFGTIFRALTATSREVTDYFGGSGTIKTPRTNITITYKKNGEEGDGTDLTDYFIKLKEENPDLNLDDIHDNFQFDNDDYDCNGTDDDSKCIFRLSAANVTNGDGKVMLGLKKGYTLTIKGKNENSMKDTTVYITPEKFLSLAYEFAGTANYFALGRMYYYAPIYHNVASVPENGPANVGDIGVVRNNWYKLTISSLLKPGIPVSDPDQPIIPNVDPSDRYLGLDIHILPWHVISQDITLQ